MKIKTHSDIIGLWPSVDDLSREINVKYSTVYAWYRRSAIPSEYWSGLIKAGKKHGHKITAQLLLDTR